MRTLVAYLCSFSILLTSTSVYAQLPASCPNGVTQAQLAQVQALLSGESQGTVDKKINEMCNDPNLNFAKLNALLSPIPVPPAFQPPATVQVPDSIKRRLILNNQVSNITPDTWPATAWNLINTGQLPPGVDPYFPEEKEALKMLGFSDNDLNSIPPAGNIQEKLDAYADKKYEETKGGAQAMAFGYSFGLAMIILYAFTSIGLFIQCKSIPSSIIFFTSSMIYLAKEIILIYQYVKYIKDIIKTMEHEPSKKFMATIDEYERAVNDGLNYVDQGQGLVDQGQDVAAVCQSALGATTPTDPRIANCVNQANQLGIDAQTLKNNGVAWLNCQTDRLKKSATTQYQILKKAYDIVEKLKNITLEKAISATIVSAAWLTAEGFAIAEAANPATGFGACAANVPVKQELDIKYYVENLLGIPKAEAGKENAEREFKDLGNTWIAVILFTILPFLPMLAASIHAGWIAAREFGVQRAIIMGVAAVTATVGMGFLWKAYDYLSGIVHDMGILLKALKRTFSNEGINVEDGKWEDAKNESEEQSCQELIEGSGAGSFQKIKKIEALDKMITLLAPLSDVLAKMPNSQSQNSKGKACIAGNYKPDLNCNCASSGGCFNKSLSSIPIPKNVPSKALANHFKAYKEVSKAQALLSKGDMKGAAHYASRLQKRIPVLQKEHQLLNKVLNINLAKNKKRPISLENEKNRLRRKFEQGVKNHIKRYSPAEQEKLLGMYAPSKTNPPPLASEAMQNRQGKISKGLSSLKKFLASLGQMGKRYISSNNPDLLDPRPSSDPLEQFSSDFSDNEQEALDETFKKADEFVKSQVDLPEDIEVSGSDISNAPEASIFKIITNRYFKSFLGR